MSTELDFTQPASLPVTSQSSKSQSTTNFQHLSLQRLKWTELMEDALLEFLKQEEALGKRADGWFRRPTWEAAVAVIKRLLPENHNRPPVTASRIQHKWENFKREFAAFTQMKNASGIGWDENAQRPTCSDDVWNTYIKSHKDAIKFRTKGLRNYDRLAELLGSRRATGEFASVGRSPSLRVKSESDVVSQSLPQKRPYEGQDSSSDDSGEVVEIRSDSESPTPSSSQASTPAPTKRPRRGKQNKINVAQLLSFIQQSNQVAATRKLGIRNQAQVKLAKEFPILTVKEKLAVFELFENEVKAEIFVGIMGDMELATAWLHKELKMMGLDNSLSCSLEENMSKNVDDM